MAQNRDSLEQLLDGLRRLDISAHVDTKDRADGDAVRATLVRRSSSADYLVALEATDARLVASRTDRRDPVLVFSPFVGSKTATALRRMGINYLDAAGNAWITFDDVLVDIQGRTRPDSAVPTDTRPKRGSLLTPRSAQVVFALLAWPDLWEQSRRQLARAAGVSLGQAHNTATMLNDRGYHAGTGGRAQKPLLDLWTSAFLGGLAEKLTLGTFHGDITHPVVSPTASPVEVSGEVAASDLLRPAALTAYVPELDPRLPVLNRWRVDADPNITIRRRFWTPPDRVPESTHLAAGRAPWPIVYADLIASDDPRVRGVASRWQAGVSGKNVWMGLPVNGGG